MKFIEDPPEGQYLPALYKGEDQTGKVFGRYKVLGRSSTKRYGGNKIVARWTVLCLDCETTYSISAQRARENKYGCHTCAHKSMAGNNHANWRGGNHVPGYFVAQFRVKSRTRARGTLEWDLTIEYLDELWVKQGAKCAYTGWPLQFGKQGLLEQEQTASLDRIDSTKGYVPGNVQFVHKDINRLKWDLPEDRFIELCRAVTDYANEGDPPHVDSCR
ncbi:hypothetical protein [Microbispora sp. NPDC049633]|uniref:hypothetical protein n=1 Tax=Microbispora sp. NPDC049633 TaxID=3154355 RepID=UPI00341914A3